MAAKKKIPFRYVMYQNPIKSSKTYGKWYARAAQMGTLNLEGVARHISHHGSIYTEDVVYGVLKKFKSCLLELIMQNQRVKIDGLGTFYISLSSTGEAKRDDYSIGKNLRSARIRFLADQVRDEGLQGTTLANSMLFEEIALQQEAKDEEPQP